MPTRCQESLIVYQCGVMSRLGVIMFDVTHTRGQWGVSSHSRVPPSLWSPDTRPCPLLMSDVTLNLKANQS